MRLLGVWCFVGVLGLVRPAWGFNYPEHREITASSIRTLLAEEDCEGPRPDHRLYDMLTSLSEVLRDGREGALPLCRAENFAAPLQDAPQCFDAADLPALSADHSSSPAALMRRWTRFSEETSSEVGNLFVALPRLDRADRSPSYCNDVEEVSNPALLIEATRAARVGARYAGPGSIDDRLEVADAAYLCLAEFSRPHFRLPEVLPIDAALSASENAASAYARYHLGALIVAQYANEEAFSNLDRTQVEGLALMLEMYALHFLEDSFAAGHIVTPRLHVGDAAARASHDRTNREGLWVRLPDALCQEADNDHSGDAVPAGLRDRHDRDDPWSLLWACDREHTPLASDPLDRGRGIVLIHGDHAFMGTRRSQPDQVSFNLARLAVTASLRDVRAVLRGTADLPKVTRRWSGGDQLPALHGLRGTDLLSTWDNHLSHDVPGWSSARLLHEAVRETRIDDEVDETVRPLRALLMLPTQAELRPEEQALSGLTLRARSGVHALYRPTGTQADSWNLLPELGFGFSLVTPPPTGSMYFQFGLDFTLTLPTRLSDASGSVVPGFPFPTVIPYFGVHWRRTHITVGWRFFDPLLVFDGEGDPVLHPLGMGAEVSVGVRAATWNFSALDVDFGFRVTGDLLTGDTHLGPGLVLRFSTIASRVGVTSGRVPSTGGERDEEDDEEVGLPERFNDTTQGASAPAPVRAPVPVPAPVPSRRLPSSD